MCTSFLIGAFFLSPPSGVRPCGCAPQRAGRSPRAGAGKAPRSGAPPRGGDPPGQPRWTGTWQRSRPPGGAERPAARCAAGRGDGGGGRAAR